LNLGLQIGSPDLEFLQENSGLDSTDSTSFSHSSSYSIYLYISTQSTNLNVPVLASFLGFFHPLPPVIFLEILVQFVV